MFSITDLYHMQVIDPPLHRSRDVYTNVHVLLSIYVSAHPKYRTPGSLLPFFFL